MNNEGGFSVWKKLYLHQTQQNSFFVIVSRKYKVTFIFMCRSVIRYREIGALAEYTDVYPPATSQLKEGLLINHGQNYSMKHMILFSTFKIGLILCKTPQIVFNNIRNQLL